MRPALDVANYFIECSDFTKTNLQVMKLTYISHGYMLALYGKPLIYDEVEAWTHGPVIPAIYRKFKKWGSRIIERTAQPKPEPFTGEERGLLDSVFETYGRYCGYYLSQITHHDGDRITPWAQCYVKGRNIIIPDPISKKYYEILMA